MSNQHENAVKDDYEEEFTKVLDAEKLFEWSNRWIVKYDSLEKLEAERKRWSEPHSVFTKLEPRWDYPTKSGIVLRDPLAVLLTKQEGEVYGGTSAQKKEFLIAGVILDPVTERRELRNFLLDPHHDERLVIAGHHYAFFCCRLVRDRSDVANYRDFNPKTVALRNRLYEHNHIPDSWELYSANIAGMVEVVRKAKLYQAIVNTPEFLELESICCNFRVANILKGHGDLETMPDLVKHLLKAYKV